MVYFLRLDKNIFFVFKIRVLEYFYIARAVILDSLWRLKKNVLTYVLFSSLALFSTSISLAIFLQAMKAFEKNVDFSFFGITLPQFSPANHILVIIFIGGIFFVFSSFMQLYAELRCNTIGRLYGNFCAERIISNISSFVNSTPYSWSNPDLSKIKEVISGGSQTCARVVVGILGTIPAAISFIVYSGFLIYLDPTTTISIFSVISVFSPFFVSPILPQILLH